MRKENRMDDKATSPDPDDLSSATPPTRPLSPDERRKFEEEVLKGQEEPGEDLPEPPPETSSD